MCAACFVNHKPERDTQGRMRHWNEGRTDSVICGDWLCAQMTDVERRYWLDKWSRHI